MELLLIRPKVKSIKYDDVNNIEVFEIAPLEARQAAGVFGNSLRTTLMSHVPGFAVTNFKVGYRKEGEEDFTMVPHEYMTIPGVMPNMTYIFTNLKESLFKLSGVKEKEVTITKKGIGVITLGDFASEDLIVLNPEKVVLEIVDENTEITISLKIQEGRGYKQQQAYDTEGWLSIDGIFTPIVKVAPVVREMRVNGESGYEKLEITIQTNGKMTPKEALDTGIRIIQEGYNVLREGIVDVIDNESIYYEVDEEEVKLETFKNIDELDLSVRAYNALKSYGINNTGDFERYTEKQIRDIDNLGKKTFTELKNKLAEHGIELKK